MEDQILKLVKEHLPEKVGETLKKELDDLAHLRKQAEQQEETISDLRKQVSLLEQYKEYKQELDKLDMIMLKVDLATTELNGLNTIIAKLRGLLEEEGFYIPNHATNSQHLVDMKGFVETLFKNKTLTTHVLGNNSVTGMSGGVDGNGNNLYVDLQETKSESHQLTED